jgi:histo-blood group ABO system transferase
MEVGIILIATGKYHYFINQTITSLNKYFLSNINKKIFLFTDSKEKYDAISIPVEHKPFPYPTLYRYKMMCENIDVIKNTDYIFYLDVDSKVISGVGREILGSIVATEHPYFRNRKGPFPYERSSYSTAYIERGIGNRYYCGGFQGGKTERYLRVASIINYNIMLDEENGIMAEWHDESHWNCYLAYNPPEVTLDISYMIPEERMGDTFADVKPKILALYKNHAEMRIN